MPNFNMVLTASGAELLAGAIVGTELTFTAIVLGDGVYDGAETDAAALASERLRLPITSIRRQGNAVSLRAAMRYEDAGEGFVWRELGVLARDPAGGADVLYSYANSGNQADTIPAAGAATVLEKIINVKALVASAASVTAVVDSSLVYLTQVDLDAHDADPGANPAAIGAHDENPEAHDLRFLGKADLVDGKVPAEQLPAMEYEPLGSVAAHDRDPMAHDGMLSGVNATLANHEARITRLEDSLFNDITGNPHTYGFDSLTGITVVSGCWNKNKARLEC